MGSAKNGNLLIIYAANSTFTVTVKEYLEAFSAYSDMNVLFMDGTRESRSHFDLDFFDAILVTYSLRLSLKNYIHPLLAKKLSAFKGPKGLTIQDEYDNTEQARQWIERLGFSFVFTCVPDEYRENIYPSSRFPTVRFINVLTGYVPIRLIGLKRSALSDRPQWIVYRGRPLHPVYGMLGYEKLSIGQRMAAECAKRAIPSDIKWEEDDRIYGSKWYEFLASSRATLGTESGANVFDFDGELFGRVCRLMLKEPELDFMAIHKRLLSEVDGRDAKMNQISPKVFEAIALGTGLILFEGSYSGVLTPHKHYLPLKKDFSNIEQIFQALNDVEQMQKMVECAYADIVLSGAYSYESFVKKVVGALQSAMTLKPHAEPISLAVFADVDLQQAMHHVPLHGFATNRPLLYSEWTYLRRSAFVIPLIREMLPGFRGYVRFTILYAGHCLRKTGKFLLNLGSLVILQKSDFLESSLKRRLRRDP